MHGNISQDLAYDQQHLSVGKNHRIFVEQSGNPFGTPVLYLHGGPGAGLGTHYKWPFDLNKYRVIGFDQRGCGKSRPTGSVQENTTELSLQDIETIRQHLDIEQWILFGGSWGSTLALLYAIAHPNTVKGIVLRGVFLAREQDFDWFLMPNGGAAQVYPDAYARFASGIVSGKTIPTHYQQICERYYEMFEHPEQYKKALQNWYNWEGNISKLLSSDIDASDISTDIQVRNLALLECHYLLNQCFIQENQILDTVAEIEHLPCFIVHGRYDMVCKVEAAYSLHKALPRSKLTIIDNAGHSMSESGIAKSLVDTMREHF